MMNEESTARADDAEQVEVSPAPKSTTTANDVNGSMAMVKTKGGCCSSTKKFFLYDSSRPEIQAFYFNQVRVSLLCSIMYVSVSIHKKRSLNSPFR